MIRKVKMARDWSARICVVLFCVWIVVVCSQMTPSLKQPRPQGLSSLPPLVVGTVTLVAAGHVTTQNLGSRKIC